MSEGPAQAAWQAAASVREHARQVAEGLPSLRRLAGGPTGDRRLLAVWDFRVVTHSLGDLIVLLQRLELLRWEQQLDQVDLALVWDPDQPAVWDCDHYDCGVTAANWHYHLPALLSVAYLSRATGSVLLFNSHAELEAYVGSQAGRYAALWPTGWQYLERDLSHSRLYDCIQAFALQHKFVPWLQLRPATIRWVREFHERYVGPDDLIVAQFRNNPARSTVRNANLEACLEFVDHCRERYPAKFVLIGAAHEVDDRFRQLPNVIVAKDLRTTLEQDFALANRAMIYLGGSSGPTIMATFSDTPFLQFNTRCDWESIPEGGKPAFSGDRQRFFWEPETTELMITEFARLYAEVDRGAWWDRLVADSAGLGDGATRSNMGWEQ